MTEYQDSHFSKGLKESDLYILTGSFKVLGNPVRIRILLPLKPFKVKSAFIRSVGGTGALRHHLLDMGPTPKTDLVFR